jgi:Rrf2 family protein
MPFPGFSRISSGLPFRFPNATPACRGWVFPAKSQKVKMRNEPNPAQENYQVLSVSICLTAPFMGASAVDPWLNCLLRQPSLKTSGSSILNQDWKGPLSKPDAVLKLTKKADYGLIALRHLASVPGGTASTKDIAEAYHLPVTLLAKVLQQLTRAGILQSIAGTNGGYKLSRDARRISALEVVRAIDGPVILTHCFTEHGTCDQSESCTVREPLRRVHEAILELLDRFTITDLAESPAVKLTPLPTPLHSTSLNPTSLNQAKPHPVAMENHPGL